MDPVHTKYNKINIPNVDTSPVRILDIPPPAIPLPDYSGNASAGMAMLNVSLRTCPAPHVSRPARVSPRTCPTPSGTSAQPSLIIRANEMNCTEPIDID